MAVIKNVGFAKALYPEAKEYLRKAYSGEVFAYVKDEETGELIPISFSSEYSPLFDPDSGHNR